MAASDYKFHFTLQ